MMAEHNEQSDVVPPPFPARALIIAIAPPGAPMCVPHSSQENPLDLVPRPGVDVIGRQGIDYFRGTEQSSYLQ